MTTIPQSKQPIHCVAVVQTAPVMFDIERTLEKVADLTSQAAANGAKLVVFPEATLSAYPKGAFFGSFMGGAQRRDANFSAPTGKVQVSSPAPLRTVLAKLHERTV